MLCLDRSRDGVVAEGSVRIEVVHDDEVRRDGVVQCRVDCPEGKPVRESGPVGYWKSEPRALQLEDCAWEEVDCGGECNSIRGCCVT